jgi:hypothetical protein
VENSPKPDLTVNRGIETIDEASPLVQNNLNERTSSNFEKIMFTFKEVTLLNTNSDMNIINFNLMLIKTSFFMVTIFFVYATTFSVFPAVYSAVKPTTSVVNKFTSNPIALKSQPNN